MCKAEKLTFIDCDRMVEGKEYCYDGWHITCKEGQVVYLYKCPDAVIEERKSRLFEKSFDSFNTSLQPKAVAKAKRFIQRVVEGQKGYLILMGITGCGKTHLAMAIANEFIMAGLEVMFIRYIELANILREAKREGTLEPLFDLIDVDVLIIDDLGSSSVTGSFIEGFQYILDMRDGRPIIITTNLNRKDIENIYGPKIYSRLMEYGVGVAFEKIDYRQRRR